MPAHNIFQISNTQTTNVSLHWMDKTTLEVLHVLEDSTIYSEFQQRIVKLPGVECLYNVHLYIIPTL